MDNFKNLYELTKTLQFELKPVHNRGKDHEDNINFETTKDWVDTEYFNEKSKTEDKKQRNEKIRTSLRELFNNFDIVKNGFSYLLKQLDEKNIPPFCVFVQAPLLENFDANLFYKQKKKSRFNQTKLIPLSHLRIKNSYSWFIVGLKEKLEFIDRYKFLITSHQLWEQSDFEEMQNNAKWYADIESFSNRYDEFLEFLEKKYISIPKDIEIKKHGILKNSEKDIVEKIREKFKNLQTENLRDLLKNIIEEIKENKFIECGITGLNDKSLNKNLQKRKQSEEWLKNLLDTEQPKILSQIHQLDDERKIILDGDSSKNQKGLYALLNEESKKWVQNKTDKCSEFAIHLLQTPKYNQEIQNLIARKKELQNTPFHERTVEDKNELWETKEKIYQLKIEKAIIQERKRLFLDKGVLSFKYKLKNKLSIDNLIEKIMENPQKAGVFLNFQNIWKIEENISVDFRSITQNKQFIGLYFANRRLLKGGFDKFKNKKMIGKKELSQKYGNNKSLINSLQREIERQGKIKNWSIVLRDKDFYYLAFLARENRKELFGKYFINSEQSEYEYLEYERLTFKALEKLALIENATFKEFDDINDEKLAQDLRNIYQTVYKEKQFNEYKLTRDENQYVWKNRINKFDFAKEQQEKIKDDVIKILVKVVEKLGYSFTSKSNYNTLDEFASDINIQCYKTNWHKVDWQKLLEGEKAGDIQLFKIHNKDFSRKKREYQRSKDMTKHRKNNLFTEYWIDLFEKNNENIRLLSEIDLFKRRKEFDKGNFKKIVTKRNKQEITGTDAENNRFFENKFYASFRFQFYPEKISPIVKEFNDNLESKTQNSKKYFLGLDRGENELLTYCLINKNKNVVIDEKTKKPIIGDWNLDDNNFDYAEKLKDFHKKREELLEKSRLLQNSNEEEKKQKIQEELDEINLLESESIKTGFCGHVLEQINNIMMQYKNVYIVMEDLDRKQNKEEKGSTSKEKNLEKLLGATAYQSVEDAIISKFKYYQTKDSQFNGSQIVPNIERIRDLRVVEDNEKLERNKYGRIKFAHSKEQIGNLLFVDDFLTSQMCPDCEFCICGEKEKKRAEKFGKPITKKKIQKMNWNSKDLIVGNKFKIKQKRYIQNESNIRKKTKDILSNVRNVTSVNSNILGLLIPRLKARKNLYKNISRDPFFCPSCGKNTEENNFAEPLKSGDDIASYNIAKRGLKICKIF